MVGLKYDTGKPMMSLIPPEAEEALAWVLTFGTKKYEAENYREGIHFSRILSAAYRHLNKYRRGDFIDDESKLPHLWHSFCCIAFLIVYESDPKKYGEFNDLFFYRPEQNHK